MAVTKAPIALAQSDSDWIIEVITERANAHGRSPAMMIALARCESRFNPYAVGRAGERGIFQLHPQGLLRTFYAWGYDDHSDVWQQADFTARALANGLRSHWAC